MFAPHVPFIAKIEIARNLADASGRQSLRLTLTESRVMGGGTMGLTLHAMGDWADDKPDMLDMLEAAIRALREREAARKPPPPIRTLAAE